MYSLDDYDYVLPEERIAQTPAPVRHQARQAVQSRFIESRCEKAACHSASRW